jgi:UDP-4-amino-4,6-dideoxy-N-acetyl-beta-L-altrosamine N-acetyltransferase
LKINFKDFKNLNLSEHRNIVELRNSDYIRTKMINDSLISLENHLEWIVELKKDKKKSYYAIIFEENIIGAIYFNKIESLNAEWGFYFSKSVNPIISSATVYLFILYLFKEDFFKKIFSKIKKDNNIALNFNKNFGFESWEEDEKYFYLKLEKQNWENNKKTRFIKSIKKYLDKIEHEFT